MKQQTLRIATRKSPLAMWQAHAVKAALLQHHPQLDVQLVPMQTKGDVILDSPLAKIGGKGLFLKELEVALLNHEADLAVHSMKDVPVAFPEGLMLATYCERDDPLDALVSNRYPSLQDLPQGAILGTSSLRRQAQLKALRPDLQIRDLRGNVGTRLAKLDAGDYDAIVLACAGLKRLDLQARIAMTLPPSKCLPANAQGAIGIECRSDDEAVKQLLAPLDHAPTRARVLAERAVNARLDGGCQVPLASYAVFEGKDTLWVRGLVGAVDGSVLLKAERRGPTSAAQELGMQVAEDLLASGAAPLLAQLTSENPQKE